MLDYIIRAFSLLAKPAYYLVSWRREYLPILFGVSLIIGMVWLVGSPATIGDPEYLFKVLGLGGGLTLLFQHLLRTRFSEDDQLAERFSRAVAHLGGKDNPLGQLGGICVLERIIRDSPRDHWQIVEYLCALARQPSAENPGPFGIQPLLTVIGRRPPARIRLQEGGRRLDLRAIALRDADLSEARLERALLTRAQLPHALCRNTQFVGADLSGANFSDASMPMVNLEKANLNSADLSRARVTGGSFRGALMRDTKLTGTEFTDDLDGTPSPTLLGRIRLDGVSAEGANFRGAVFSRKCAFSGCYLPSTRFDRPNFRASVVSDGVVFDRADLNGADFGGANLSVVSCQDVHLESANFHRAQINQVDFNNATLTNVDFRGAHLDGVNFRGALLTSANFRGAHLDGVDFRGALLTSADFRGTHRHNILLWAGADIHGALFDGPAPSTALPKASPSSIDADPNGPQDILKDAALTI
jgi:uncharacterized protein YjbI with pentapeptide repeats